MAQPSGLVLRSDAARPEAPFECEAGILTVLQVPGPAACSRARPEPPFARPMSDIAGRGNGAVRGKPLAALFAFRGSGARRKSPVNSPRRQRVRPDTKPGEPIYRQTSKNGRFQVTVRSRMRDKIKAKGGTIRPLDPADPRNPDHPSHEEQWLEVARAIGRAMADRDFEEAQRKRTRTK
jgi:hypothetical protein